MLILCFGDTHLREDIPVCRTDDYLLEQERKFKWIIDLAKSRKVDLLLHSGDLFDHWKPSPSLLAKAIRQLQGYYCPMTVPGNHDLPQHNLDLVYNSGFGVLLQAEAIKWEQEIYEADDGTVITSVPWGCTPAEVRYKDRFNVLVWHHFAYRGKEPFPGASKEGTEAVALLEKYKDYDLILTGHNHQSFDWTLKIRDLKSESSWRNTVIINPGSMMRMTAAQIDHKPCVYLFDTSTREFEKIFIPIKEGVVTREHIEISEYKDARINAFIERLRDDIELKMSFSDNIERYMTENDVRMAVRDVVRKSMEVK